MGQFVEIIKNYQNIILKVFFCPDFKIITSKDVKKALNFMLIVNL